MTRRTDRDQHAQPRAQIGVPDQGFAPDGNCRYRPAISQQGCHLARESHPDLVHFALAVGGFAIGTTEFATMSLLPYFARDLGISAPMAGHAISAYALGVVLGAPLIRVGGRGAEAGGVRSSRRAGAMAATTAGAGGSGSSGRGWIANGARRAGSGA